MPHKAEANPLDILNGCALFEQCGGQLHSVEVIDQGGTFELPCGTKCVSGGHFFLFLEVGCIRS